MTLTSVNPRKMDNSAQMSGLPIIFGHYVIPEELHLLHLLHRYAAHSIDTLL